jgi:hypothetical protein
MDSITDNYLNVQQDILETFVDRHQLKALTAPTILPGGKRIPGLKLDHPRQLALMHALVRFANVAASNSFRTCDLRAPAAAALGCPPSQYRLSSLRYDLSKLRAKGRSRGKNQARIYRPKTIVKNKTQSGGRISRTGLCRTRLKAIGPGLLVWQSDFPEGF